MDRALWIQSPGVRDSLSLGLSMVSDRNRDKAHYEIITNALKVDNGDESGYLESWNGGIFDRNNC